VQHIQNQFTQRMGLNQGPAISVRNRNNKMPLADITTLIINNLKNSKNKNPLRNKT